MGKIEKALVVIRQQIESLKISTRSTQVQHYMFTTGSRRFGYATPSSDYDFCMHDTDSYRAWIKEMGFVPIYNEYVEEKDEDTTAIYQLTDGIQTIQVTISRDAAGKLRTYEWLDKHPHIVKAYYSLPKSERGAIWRFLHKMKEEGKI